MKIGTILALMAVLAVSSQAAAINNMNDYDMGSGTSMNDDLFGFGLDPTVWYGVQFTFTNVTFKDGDSGPFDLKGFEIYLGNLPNTKKFQLLATTGACAGIVTPLPAVQTAITCAVPGGVTLTGTPYFVFPISNSVGKIGRTDPQQESTVEMRGIEATAGVPEPSTAALTGLSVIGGVVLRRRLGAAFLARA